jgi:hypothetical protein
LDNDIVRRLLWTGLMAAAARCAGGSAQRCHRAEELTGALGRACRGGAGHPIDYAGHRFVIAGRSHQAQAVTEVHERLLGIPRVEDGAAKAMEGSGLTQPIADLAGMLQGFAEERGRPD